MLSTAARALAVGNPLLALQGIALRNDAPALALRGAAMAQLGELVVAKKLLRRAVRKFAATEVVARARCITALAEVALASRELSGGDHELEQAAQVLGRRGDSLNAFLAQLVRARRYVMLGRIAEAAALLDRLNVAAAPARLFAIANLVLAEVSTRQLRAKAAAEALERARRAAALAAIPALEREVERALTRFGVPVARLLVGGESVPVDLARVEEMRQRRGLIVDACRRELGFDGHAISLRRRPVLFALLLALAKCAPHPVERDRLIASTFDVRHVNQSHRVRLRVEIGRLRKLIGSLAEIRATTDGFALLACDEHPVSCVLPPAEGESSALTALLSSGDAWSTSALSLALGRSQRSVQRALRVLEEAGAVRSLGSARAQRWVVVSSSEFATSLLLVTRDSLG